MISINKNKFILLVLVCLTCIYNVNAQTFISRNVKINIFSSTPVEDIKAASNGGNAVLITSTQEIAVQLAIKSLSFDKKLMQEHFNENYMESDKYPLAKFKGNFEPKIDWSKDGEYTVAAKGILSVHGIDQPRTITGKIAIKNGMITLNSNFDVACAAHKIKIPSLVFTKIAEVIKINIQATLTSLK
ncbi:YceI family protein [Pedobacter polaris]|uniref:YceI family protein n=1 Tax=Pedobacter polaris TaxID=2571273 RepID=A0A4U1CVT8_9SPHI|nr:YceI family protein [Pedobacter polaris]TKC12270.1 YceI family protein [Pedobacter polaris]